MKQCFPRGHMICNGPINCGPLRRPASTDLSNADLLSPWPMNKLQCLMVQGKYQTIYSDSCYGDTFLQLSLAVEIQSTDRTTA